MAEFVEVMKQRKRMCEVYEHCKDCGLSANKNGKHLGCDIFSTDYPQEAEKIIMDWAKEHPVKTNADKFKEVFGVELYFCKNACLGFECNEDVDCEKCEHRGFWNREYVEPKKENEDGKID